jgi:putative ABC transport system permease protein
VSGVRTVALRGILDHKGRLVLTLLAVVLGVAFIGGVLTLTDTMNSAFDDLFADVYRDTDAVVRGGESIEASDGGGGGIEIRDRLDAEVLDQVEQANGVAAAIGDVGGYARIIDKEGDPVGNPAMGAPTFGANWSENDDLNPFNLTSGSEDPSGPGEIVIDAASAESTGYEVGDTVPVLARDGVDEYELVGIARFGTADSPGGASFVLWTTEEAQRIVGEPGEFDSVSVVAHEGVSQTDVARSIERQLDNEGTTGVEVLTGQEITEETQTDVQESLLFITVIFTTFATIALFVGSFVIYNSFSIIVAQRSREMALLRAVGASRKQVRRAVLIEATVIGVIGSVAGFLLGLALAAFFYNLMGLPEGGLAILPVSAAQALITGLLVTLSSAYFPARRASKVPPLAAMRDVDVDTTGRSRVRFVAGLVATGLGVAAVIAGVAGTRPAVVGVGVGVVFVGVLLLGPALVPPVSRLTGAPLARLRGVTGRLARDNAGRNPKRTSATAQALMIGVGIVAFFLVINASIRASLDKTLEESFAGDFVIDSGTFGFVGMPTGVAESIRELPEVDQATPMRFAPAVVDGDDGGVTASDEQVFDLLGMELVEGSGTLARGDVVVNADTAEDDGLRVGDTVEIRLPDQLSGDGCEGGACEYEVAGVYDSSDAGAGIGGYVMNLDDYADGVLDVTDSQVFVRLAEGVTVEEAEPAIERVVEPFVTVEVQSVDEYKDAIGSWLDQVLLLILVLLALAIVIALLGIVNTVSLSVLERTRELGLLRAVGMSRRQVRSAIRWESVIISLFGTLLGMAIGLLASWGLVSALGDEGFEVFRVPVGTLVVVALVAGLLGMGAAVFPAWRASRLDVLDAIQTE